MLRDKIKLFNKHWFADYENGGVRIQEYSTQAGNLLAECGDAYNVKPACTIAVKITSAANYSGTQLL